MLSTPVSKNLWSNPCCRPRHSAQRLPRSTRSRNKFVLCLKHIVFPPVCRCLVGRTTHERTWDDAHAQVPVSAQGHLDYPVVLSFTAAFNSREAAVVRVAKAPLRNAGRETKGSGRSRQPEAIRKLFGMLGLLLLFRMRTHSTLRLFRSHSLCFTEYCTKQSVFVFFTERIFPHVTPTQRTFSVRSLLMVAALVSRRILGLAVVLCFSRFPAGVCVCVSVCLCVCVSVRVCFWRDVGRMFLSPGNIR